MATEAAMYRMTEAERQIYLMLLLSGREEEALKHRDKCDDYWVEHPEEWDAIRIPDNAPSPI